MMHHTHHRGAGRLPLLVALLLAAVGCGQDGRDINIEITLGHESDAFQQQPAVTKVVVEARLVDNAVFARAETTPGGSFELGQLDSGVPLHFEVTGYGDDGALLVRGRSLTVDVAQLQGDVLPLFAQRIDRWARPPGSIDHAHVGGVTAALGERFLGHTGGDVVGGDATAGSMAFYDMLAWGPAQGGTHTKAPASVVVAAAGDMALFINSEEAYWIDFAHGDRSVTVDAPDGLGDFASVAGGASIRGDGVSYVVGATRTNTASDKVLLVADDLTLTSATLTAPRLGAAAAWVKGSGLAVAGGSDSAAGVEVLATGASTFAARPFPPDASHDAAATSGAQAGQLLLVGGLLGSADAGARRLNLACSSMCTAGMLAAQLPRPLSHTQAFVWSGGDLLVLGHNSGDNLLHSYLLSTAGASVRELLLREPRRGARALAAPNGTLILMGGALENGEPALTIESLFPR